MQELLIHHSEPIDMLEKLQEACKGIQCRLDKFRRVHHHDALAGVIAGLSRSSGVVPMEVDALKKGNTSGGSDSCTLFMKFMRGHCFGCGATDHTKKQAGDKCPAKGKHCTYCRCSDHLKAVCSDRVLGKEKHLGLKTKERSSKPDRPARIRAIEEDSSDEEEQSASARELDKLLAQQKEIATRVAALRKKAGF